MRKSLSNFLVALFSVSFISLFSVGEMQAADVVRSGKDADGIYLESSLSEGKAVVGSSVLYEVSVVSPTPNLSLISTPSRLEWGALDASPLAGESRFRKVVEKKQVVYKAVIARYWVSASSPGKYQLPSARYIIGVPKEKIVRDPFWGNMRQTYYDPLDLEAPSLSLKVESLPKVPADFDFSGAVGEFDISVWIPEGYIGSGQEAIAIVNISGKGDLSQAAIPDLKEAFSGNARLKSIKEERSSFVKDDALFSEIELEVTFIPHVDSDGNSPQIGELLFGYYSPMKGKYQIAVSAPVDVPIGYSSRKKSAPAEFGV